MQYQQIANGINKRTMNFLFYILAIIGGVFLAIQAGFNSQLGNYLKEPLVAVITTSISSVVFGVFILLVLSRENIHTLEFSQVPWYLWFIGGLFSVSGISIYFYVIPKLGISKMIALGLCGQLVFSLIAGKYGWFNLPIEPITSKRLIGTISMITGIILFNIK